MTTPYESLAQREAQVFCHTYGRYPLAVAHAAGTRLFDLDGNTYVDLLAGIAVVNLGHCRPELARVMAEQAQRLVHVSNLFYQEQQVILAEKLVATCHAQRVFLCNSGAEANEAAVKLARRYMQKKRGRNAYEIVTLQGSFHGRTLAMIAATGQDRIKDGFAPMPQGFVSVPWDDLGAVERAIGPQTAGILVEMVQGEGGVRPMSQAYASGLQALCREKNVLLMVDEIQTGLGRTGSFWAYQGYGLAPDIFTSAKGLANGLPVGAMLATEDVASGFEPGTHASTFGGGPVVAAVASKVLDLLQQEKLAERAAKVGEYALAQFAKLKAEFPDKIADVRGRGLLLGIELSFPAQPIWKRLLEQGFVLNCTQERVLRLLPPLIIETPDIDDFTATLRTTLSAC